MFENNISDKNNNNIQDGPGQDEVDKFINSLMTKQKESW